MNATVVVLGVVVALAAAVRSTWSPCGQSMLSQLTPVGEASRGYRYRTTACWFIAGAVVGGAMLGGVMAALAVAVSSLDATATTLLGIAAAVALLGAAVDSGVLGFGRRSSSARSTSTGWGGTARGCTAAASVGRSAPASPPTS